MLTRIKKGKYYKAVKEGFDRIWSNKSVWFWGLLISSGSAMNFSQDSGSTGPISEQYIQTLFSDYWHWIVSGLLLFMVLIILMWVVSAIARVGVIKEIDAKQNNKKHVLGFKKVWKTGKKDFKKMIWLDLYLLGVVLLVILINGLVAIPLLFTGINQTFGLFVFALVILISVLFVLGLAILKPLAQINMLLANLEIKEAFLRGWLTIKKNVKEVFKLIATFIVLAVFRGLIFFAVSFIAILFGAILYQFGIGSGEVLALGAVLIILGIVIALFVLILLLTIRAFFALWEMDILIWWVKLLNGAKAPKKTIKKAKKAIKKPVAKKKLATAKA